MLIKTSLIYKLPANVIKTLKTTDNAGITDTSHKVRRTFVETLDSNGVATFSAGANETFDSHVKQTTHYHNDCRCKFRCCW